MDVRAKHSCKEGLVAGQTKGLVRSCLLFFPSIKLCCQEIRKIDSKAEIGLIFRARERFDHEIPASILECAKALRAAIFSPEHSYLKDKNQVQSLQKMGFRIIPWTVNEPNRWKELIEMGVDGIITDFPIALLDFN